MLFIANFKDDSGITYPNSDAIAGAAITEIQLTDWDTAQPSQSMLVMTTPFESSSGSSGLTSTDMELYGYHEKLWETYHNSAVATSPQAVGYIEGSELIPGNSYRVSFASLTNSARNTRMVVNGVTGVYNGVVASIPLQPNPPTEITVTAVDNGAGLGRLDFTLSSDNSQPYYYLSFIQVQNAVSGSTLSWGTDDPANTPFTGDTVVEIRTLAKATVIAAQTVTANSSGNRSISSELLEAGVTYEVIEHTSDYSRGRVFKLVAE